MFKLVLALVTCVGAFHAEADASDRLECPEMQPGRAMEEVARFRELTAGRRGGERLMCRAPDGALTYAYRFGRSSWTRTETIEFDDDGLPRFLRVDGEMGNGTHWVEQFEREDTTAKWMTPRERDEISTDGLVYYYPVNPAQDLGLLARSLLAQPDHRLKLVPGGEAHITPMASQVVIRGDEKRTVRMHAISGIDLDPQYIWLEPDGSTFAGEWMIREGWEAQYPQLRAVMDEAAYDLAAAAKRTLARDVAGTLAITGVRVFHPASGDVAQGQTILIERGRITAVSAEASAQVPSTARRLDGRGLMALPGLWDMHAHVADPRVDHPVSGPLLYLAAGITSVRDLGGEFEAVVRLRDAIADGSIAGPRIFAAGFIDHVDGEEHDIGEIVSSLEDAMAAVDKYADAEFIQIKTYNSVPRDFVQHIAKRAKERGLGVAGHIPLEMNTHEAIAAGYDEFQHLQIVHASLPMSTAAAVEAGETWATYYQLLAANYGLGSSAVEALIDDLVANDVAIDTSLALYTDRGQPPAYFADYAERLPSQVSFRLRHAQPCGFCSFPNGPFEQKAWSGVSKDWFKIINAMEKAGVTILIGSDHNQPHEVLRHEMEVLVERSGLAPSAVLRAATLSAARAVGKDRELGSIEPGKLADIILVAGDPTRDISDIRNVEVVIKDGVIFDPSMIESSFSISGRRRLTKVH